MNEATKLNKDAMGLKRDADSTARDLASELDNARRLEADAEEVREASTHVHIDSRLHKLLEKHEMM